jgi:hypothetical protein
VEGARLRTGRDNAAKHGVHVGEHVSSGNAHDVKAVTLKHRISSHITMWLVSKIMSLAIHFDDQSMAHAREIGRDSIRWKLTAEFEAARSLP